MFWGTDAYQIVHRELRSGSDIMLEREKDLSATFLAELAFLWRLAIDKKF